MKKLLIGAGVIATISQNAMAVEGQFPVLKTEKSCAINIPVGYSASQIYFSKDCATAYVLPPQMMKLRTGKVLPLAGASDDLCKALDERLKSLSAYKASRDKLKGYLDKILMEPDSESASKQVAIHNLRKQIKSYEADIRNSFKPYDEMSAIRGKVTVSNDVMDSIRAFQAANQPSSPPSDSQTLRFMPAQLTDSVLVISDKDANTDLTRSVIKVNFPGEPAPPVVGVTRDPNAKYVVMNGGLSGIVDISTAAYCGYKKNGLSMEEIFSKAVAVNLSYKVRVQVGVKLEAVASIQTKQFLRNMQNVIKKGEFDRGEFLNEVITGGLDNSLDVYIDDKGEKYPIAQLVNNSEGNEDMSPVAPLLALFMKDFVERAEAKLEQLGVFTKNPALRAKEVANGTKQEKVGEQTLCKSKSSMFGLIRSQACSTYPVYVTVSYDGMSEMIQNQEDNSTINQSIRYETNETINIPHTSTFDYSADVKD